jgi:DNA-binding NtrC family response regulator
MTAADILLVDDDLELLRSFQMILRKAGYSVQTSANGKEAIRAVRQLKFEVAIVDIKLPDIMGDEVVRQIRKIDETMAVILITGYPSLQDCIDAIDLGIQEILLKPVGADELLRVTRDALSLRQQAEAGEVSPKLV